MLARRAEQVAREAHHDQTYGDKPYYHHLQDVVWRVIQDPYGNDDCVTIAWLHDIVEDTDTNVVDLVQREGGLTERQVMALDAITRQPDELYSGYIARVCANKVATIVKYHDLQSNLAHDPHPNKAVRYRAALKIVAEARRGVEPCFQCGVPVVMIKSPTGGTVRVDRSSIPHDFDVFSLVYNPDLGHVLHFQTCPKAGQVFGVRT